MGIWTKTLTGIVVHFSDALDALGLKRYCCRRMLLSHVDLIEKLLNYAPLEKNWITCDQKLIKDSELNTVAMEHSCLPCDCYRFMGSTKCNPSQYMTKYYLYFRMTKGNKRNTETTTAHPLKVMEIQCIQFPNVLL